MATNRASLRDLHLLVDVAVLGGVTGEPVHVGEGNRAAMRRLIKGGLLMQASPEFGSDYRECAVLTRAGDMMIERLLTVVRNG